MVTVKRAEMLVWTAINVNRGAQRQMKNSRSWDTYLARSRPRSEASGPQIVDPLRLLQYAHCTLITEIVLYDCYSFPLRECKVSVLAKVVISLKFLRKGSDLTQKRK